VEHAEAARFRELYVTCYGAVLNYARRRADEQTALDVTAETFLIAWRRLSAVPVENPLPWLYKTAHLTLANETRRQRREQAFVRSSHEQAARSEGLAADHADAVVETDRVRVALSRLSAADAEILRLTSWEDLDTREVAVVVGCTVAAAKVRLFRARRRLAAALDDPAPSALIRTPLEVSS
jgi:RNA polymerase sigma factor (sigma-70 family)